LKSTHEQTVPTLPEGFQAANEVDHFIAAKFAAVKTQHVQHGGDSVDFFRAVKPLLESRCVDCHRGSKAKGNLQLDARPALLKGGASGPAVIPGDAASSELIRRVASHEEGEAMPPKGARLTDEEVATLTRWVQQGAVWPDLPLARAEFAASCDDLTFLR